MTSLNIVAVQMDIQWLDKKSNLDYLSRELESYQSADLILLPETFATGFAIAEKNIGEAEEGGIVLAWMKNTASKLQAVVAGSVLVDTHVYQKGSNQTDSSQSDMKDKTNKRVNRFYWVYPDGKVEYYDKRHLFRLGREEKYVNAGQSRKILTINGIRVLPQVCYDLRFPVWSRNREDYDLAVYVANWPSMRQHAWDTLIRARAIENQAYVVGVNRVGNDGKDTPHLGGTVIYDYAGNMLNQADDNKQQIISVQIDLDQLNKFKRKFPFYKDGDEFEITI